MAGGGWEIYDITALGYDEFLNRAETYDDPGATTSSDPASVVDLTAGLTVGAYTGGLLTNMVEGITQADAVQSGTVTASTSGWGGGPNLRQQKQRSRSINVSTSRIPG